MASALESFPCRRWRSKRCRKPRTWHGRRIRCCGTRLVKEQNSVELPITDVDLKAKIIYDCALQVTLTQTFQHNFRGFQCGPLTVSYIFPLESTSVVYSMRATLSSGVEIEGLIKEKEEAKREFVQAVQAGDTAVLMSQVDGDVFQFDVGNVDPGESIKITVSYLTTLGYDDSENIRLFVPRSITPRFGATDLRAVGVTRINYNMSVFVDITTYGRLQNVQCLSHPRAMKCTRDFNNDRHMTMTINLPIDSDGMSKDLEALITQEEVTQTHAVYEYSNIFKTHAFMISFVAQPMDEERQVEGIESMTTDVIDEDHNGVELVFLVDRSGSMAGSMMETVKRTLKKFLRSMPENCKFNLISFAYSAEYFRPESVVYNDRSFAAADEWIDRLDASGGTQLYSALNSVLNAGYDPLRARNVFVLTDGAVSNTRECIRLVDRVGENVRVFTFGIGSGHSTELVNGLAEAGNGIAISIADIDDIGTKVMTALTHALQPVIGNLNVMIQSPPNEGSPLKFDIFPRKMPALFYGRQAIFYAVAHESVQLSRDLGLSVCVTGTQNGHKPYRMNIPIDLSPFSDEGEVADVEGFGDYFADGEGMLAPAAGEETSHFGQPRHVPRQLQILASRSEGLIIHRLAAKARIQELERRSDDRFMRKQEILALATRFNLVSSETSFIAVHRDREGRQTGENLINKTAIEGKQEQEHGESAIRSQSARVPSSARRGMPVGRRFVRRVAARPSMRGGIRRPSASSAPTRPPATGIPPVSSSCAPRARPLARRGRCGRGRGRGGRRPSRGRGRASFPRPSSRSSLMLQHPAAPLAVSQAKTEDSGKANRNGSVNPVPVLSLDELTNLHKANGSFGLDVLQFAGNVPLLAQVVKELLLQTSLDRNDLELVRATLIGLVLLRMSFGDRVGEWRLMERKSLKFIGQCTEQKREVILSWIERLCQ